MKKAQEMDPKDQKEALRQKKNNFMDSTEEEDPEYGKINVSKSITNKEQGRAENNFNGQHLSKEEEMNKNDILFEENYEEINQNEMKDFENNFPFDKVLKEEFQEHIPEVLEEEQEESYDANNPTFTPQDKSL
jgi:hypothetical protein